MRDGPKNSKCNARLARSVENCLEQLGFEFREAMKQIRFEILSFIRDTRFVDSSKSFIDSRRETGMAVDQAVDPRRRVTGLS